MVFLSMVIKGAAAHLSEDFIWFWIRMGVMVLQRLYGLLITSSSYMYMSYGHPWNLVTHFYMRRLPNLGALGLFYIPYMLNVGHT